METRYLTPEEVPIEALNGLAESTKYCGVGSLELAGKLALGELKAFVVRRKKSVCYFLVSVIEFLGKRELQLDALWVAEGTGYHWRSWFWFLTQLAKEWKCWRVVTDVHKPQLVNAMLAHGCKVDYIAVSLEVGDDEHEENHQSNH